MGNSNIGLKDKIMEPLQALQLIDQALGTIETNRATHQQLQRALAVISSIVTQSLAAPINRVAQAADTPVDQPA
jgi:hypothetical protein